MTLDASTTHPWCQSGTPEIQPASKQCSRSKRRIEVSDVGGSKRMAFRHSMRFVQISESQKEETATSRVFRTPTSLWEYQTSFITRFPQHHFALYPELPGGIQPPTRRQRPCERYHRLALFQECLTSLYQPLFSPHFAGCMSVSRSHYLD